MKWTITFLRPSQLPSYTPSIVWLFPFTVVDSSLIGAPEENSRTTLHQVRVKVDVILAIAMGFIFTTSSEENEQVKNDRHNLMKVLFEYGKRHVIRKLKETRTLAPKEELVLNTSSIETPSLFDPSRIDEPTGARYEVDTDPPKNQLPGINITASHGDVNIDSDVVGRDKLTNE